MNDKKIPRQTSPGNPVSLVVYQYRHTHLDGIEQFFSNTVLKVQTTVGTVVHINAAAVSAAGKVVETAAQPVERHPVVNRALITLHGIGTEYRFVSS